MHPGVELGWWISILSSFLCLRNNSHGLLLVFLRFHLHVDIVLVWVEQSNCFGVKSLDLGWTTTSFLSQNKIESRWCYMWDCWWLIVCTLARFDPRILALNTLGLLLGCHMSMLIQYWILKFGLWALGSCVHLFF